MRAASVRPWPQASLGNHGTWRTFSALCLRAINRLVWFKILRGFHIENPDPAYLHAPDRYRCGFLEEQVLFDCAKREDYELSEAFLRSALGKGDECFGQRELDPAPPRPIRCSCRRRPHFRYRLRPPMTRSTFRRSRRGVRTGTRRRA